MKKLLIRLGVAAVAVSALVFAVSCDGPSGNAAETNQVTSQQDIYTHNQPVPTYQYSAERDALIQLYGSRNKGNINTWSVWVSNNGVPIGMCASKGFPIPYTTELTNPQQVDRNGNYTGGAASTVGQMDPNGLYPGTSMATWIMCLNPDGSLQPVYMEPMVMAYTYPVEIRDGKVVKVGEGTGNATIRPTGR